MEESRLGKPLTGNPILPRRLTRFVWGLMSIITLTFAFISLGELASMDMFGEGWQTGSIGKFLKGLAFIAEPFHLATNLGIVGVAVLSTSCLWFAFEFWHNAYSQESFVDSLPWRQKEVTTQPEEPVLNRTFSKLSLNREDPRDILRFGVNPMAWLAFLFEFGRLKLLSNIDGVSRHPQKRGVFFLKSFVSGLFFPLRPLKGIAAVIDLLPSFVYHAWRALRSLLPPASSTESHLIRELEDPISLLEEQREVPFQEGVGEFDEDQIASAAFAFRASLQPGHSAEELPETAIPTTDPLPPIANCAYHRLQVVGGKEDLFPSPLTEKELQAWRETYGPGSYTHLDGPGKRRHFDQRGNRAHLIQLEREGCLATYEREFDLVPDVMNLERSIAKSGKRQEEDKEFKQKLVPDIEERLQKQLVTQKAESEQVTKAAVKAAIEAESRARKEAFEEAFAAQRAENECTITAAIEAESRAREEESAAQKAENDRKIAENDRKIAENDRKIAENDRKIAESKTVFEQQMSEQKVKGDQRIEAESRAREEALATQKAESEQTTKASEAHMEKILEMLQRLEQKEKQKESAEPKENASPSVAIPATADPPLSREKETVLRTPIPQRVVGRRNSLFSPASPDLVAQKAREKTRTNSMG